MAEDEEEKKEVEGEGENPEDGAEGEDGEEKPKSKKKLIIIIVIAVLVLVGGGVGAFLFMKKDDGGASEEMSHGEGVSDEASAHGDEAGDEESAESGSFRAIYYDMEEFIVNLNVGSKRASFLKMTISLELLGEAQIPRIEEKMPRIRDSFQVYMRELRNEDLQGSAGLYRLREELLLRINKVVYPGKVNDILFKEILVQ